MASDNKDLGWIRFKFKREEDRAIEKIKSNTTLAPVDWYEDLDEETKAEYNKEVLDRTANVYSATYKLSPEEENLYRDRFDIDYTSYIKDPIAANELHKVIMSYIQELIGDYRWEEWLTSQNLNESIKEDLNQRKIKSWALFSDSILEKVYQKVTKEEDLDYLWNEMSRKAMSDDQQFAIDYFYNYRKMQLGLDYNKELIGDMELEKTEENLKEAAIGFKPDATSRARSSVETMMSNLDKTMEYLQGNAFVKTYKEEDAAKIKELTNVASDVIGDLLGIINATPDTKAKGMDEIRLKNYKPLEENSTEAKEEALKEKIRRAGKIFRDPDTSKDEKAKVEADIKSYKKELDSLKEEMDLDRTWKDVFGDKAEELAAKQRNFARGAKILRNGDEYLGYSPSKQIYRVIDSKTGKEVSKTFNAMAQVYGSDWKEKINEVKVDYDFSERELVRVLKKLKRGASGERGMIQAFIKALGRDITDDELFGESVNEGFTKGQKVTYLGHPGEITGVYDKNGREFVSVAYDKGYGRTKASMILASNGDVKPINENIETLLSPEDLKYYRAHRDEIEDILNAEFRSSKLSAKDAVKKHKAMKEGSCGYNTDAKTGKKLNTPGGLEERIKTLVKEFTKQK